MRKIAAFLILLLLAAASLSGCFWSRRVYVRDPHLFPVVLGPKSKALLTVRLEGKTKRVSRVVAQVIEYPTIKADLNDKGLSGDAVANDGVWSFQFEVPAQAKAGDYHWEIMALDANGNLIAWGDPKQPVQAIASIVVSVTE